jgi:hypothetical protein
MALHWNCPGKAVARSTRHACMQSNASWMPKLFKHSSEVSHVGLCSPTACLLSTDLRGNARASIAQPCAANRRHSKFGPIAPKIVWIMFFFSFDA